MSIRYKYICPNCNHDYIEQRKFGDPQFFTRCNDCGEADYKEVEQKFGYAVIKNDAVIDIVYAQLQNEAEQLTGAECVKIEDNRVEIGTTYDRKWGVLIPAGLVYEPISKKLMTPDEKAAL